MLVAHHLRHALSGLEAEGRIIGQVTLVPVANPLGLSQTLLGDLQGRFHVADGVNFNRHYPDLAEKAIAALQGRLGNDLAGNSALIRAVLRETALAEHATRPVDHLKLRLLAEAIDADLVLDLHCDSDAVMHLYCLPGQAEAVKPLAALLGCRAMLTADISGDSPFDEAISQVWAAIRKAFPDHPAPDAGIATTVELRGERDVTHEQARRDAEAIIAFLIHRGVISGEPPVLPPLACEPTPLAGAESLRASAAGILAFHVEAGARVSKGDIIADIIDPATGTVTPARAGTDGLIFARTSARFVSTGGRICNIAGAVAFRSGKLLGA